VLLVGRGHNDREVNMLARSKRHRVLAGVCGGIADWLGWSPTVVRILYVLVSVLSAAFPGILAYVILWLVMPSQEDVPHRTRS
jgi:phage shock protein PspC (stress-responsive transcriptional regulator)